MNKKGLHLVTATALISGFSIFINKFSVATTNPYVFTTLKNTLVVLLLISIVFIWRKWGDIKKLEKKDFLNLALIGLIGGAIPFLLFFKGLSLTSAASGSLIHKSMFLFIALLAFIFLKERPNKKMLIGLFALIFGTLLLSSFNSLSFNLGDGMILLAVLFWSAENIFAKNVLKKLSGLTVACGRLFFGSLILLLFLAASGQIAEIGHLNTAQISWALVTAIFLVGYVLTWYSGLKLLPASVASSFLTLGAPVTILLSLIFQGKVISLLNLFGLVLILTGIILITDLYKFTRSSKEKYGLKRT